MKSALDAFLKKLSVLFCDFFPPDRRPRTKNKSDPVVFSGGTIMMVLLWPGSWVFMKRFNCTLPASPDQVSTVPPTESPCRPSCLAKHSWLNVRHEPSCQEKAGGGAAGLRRPQFGISLLFVIHTEKNESRCRSGGGRERGVRKGERQSSKTRGLSGNRHCRNKSKAIFVEQYMLYTEQSAKWGFNYTNISHKAQTIWLVGLNHSGRRQRTAVFTG